MTAPRLVAFYLPQFHPTPENDLWWGKGFTEWTNVTAATPSFDGHWQPHLPADLGFYDLRLREARREQIALARANGIDAFCYHYYWFSGKRLLHLPLDDMLADPGSDMPFCLCWANESWTRRWSAADHDVLIEQRYLPEDDLGFIRSVEPFLRDPRYLHVDGRPLLIVYRPQHLPDPNRTLAVWRAHCRAVGIGEIHLCAALTHGNEAFASMGFDSGVEFPPHNLRAENVNDRIVFHRPFTGNVVQYATLVENYLARGYADGHVFRTVFPSWDNTARTGARALVVLNGTPGNYARWLSAVLARAQASGETDPLVFVNAWNEWAEGCHLEPDQRHGRGFLEATLAVRNGARPDNFPDIGLPAAAAEAPRTLTADLARVVLDHAARQVGRAKMWINRNPRLRAAALKIARALRRGSQSL